MRLKNLLSRVFGQLRVRKTLIAIAGKEQGCEDTRSCFLVSVVKNKKASRE